MGSNIPVNHTGKKFGRLTALEYKLINHKGHWFCKCDCGNTKSISTGKLTSGNTRSCGCLKLESDAKQHGVIKHNLSRTRFYSIWTNARQRCFNPNQTAYAKYGARGIKVSEEWLNFDNFVKDMYQSYLEHVENYGTVNTTLDRIDSAKGYSKDNCRWATMKEQTNNPTNRRKKYKYNGGEYTTKELSRMIGINSNKLLDKINSGQSIEYINRANKFPNVTIFNNYEIVNKNKENLTRLSEKRRKVLELRYGIKDGKYKTLSEVSEIFGVTRERIRQIEAKGLNELLCLDKTFESVIYLY